MRKESGIVDEVLREPSATHSSCFRVGGVSVQLSGDSAADVRLIPSLEPFRVESGASQIDIRVDRVGRLSLAPGRQLFDSGTTWELSECSDGFQFDFNAAIFGDRPVKRLLIDYCFQHAVLQMNEECVAEPPLRIEPLGYPLDELLIMHRLTQEKAIELHGAGIVRANGDANLFVGHSGAGKSTTTRLWTSTEEVEVLSDDRIIVRRDEIAGVQVPCGADSRGREHEVLRLRDRSASPTVHFAQDDKRKTTGMRMYGTPWHGEAMFASPNSAPLTRIVILEHGHGNILTRLSRSQAVAELFARAFVPFHRHEYVESALTFLEELAESVPVYRYLFEPDQRAVDTIRNLWD